MSTHVSIPSRTWTEVSAVAGRFQNVCPYQLRIDESETAPTAVTGTFQLNATQGGTFTPTGSKKLWAYIDSGTSAGAMTFQAD